MNVHRALLRSDEFAALADEIPGLELPRSFTVVTRARSVGPDYSDSLHRRASMPGPNGAGPNGAGPNGAGPNGAGPNGAGPGTARLSRLAPEALDALRFLLGCHQFSTVGLSLRAQTKSTVLIGEYSVSYGLVSGMCRTEPAARDRRSKRGDDAGPGSGAGRHPGGLQETAVQVCAMPARKLPGEITTSIWQLRDHDRADVGVTIVPRAGGRDAKWLAAHSICCLFTRKRRFADQPDIDGMIADICREDTPEKRASDEAAAKSLAGRE